MSNHFTFDAELIARYDRPGPRYTSYPTAVQFDPTFTPDAYKEAANSDQALSLYFHIPFCDTICFYCACNKIATKDRSKVRAYLDHLSKEMAMQSTLFGKQRPIEQLHWGGGTPTFLSDDEIRELMQRAGEYFNLLDDDSGEYSIEIDPREVTENTIQTLRDVGFNRMSIGLQDLNPDVQKAVNRIQSHQQTFAVMQQARETGFRSVSLDLIYGLPQQTLASFAQTLEQVIEQKPDRLSIFNYAHMPERFKPQRRISADELPDAQTKLAILQMAGKMLDEAGYVYIGMDHFALPDDELAVAQQQGNLYRNFQGYSTHAHCDLIGLGVSAIGAVGNVYAQNVKTLEEYYAALDDNKLPLERGLILHRDDEIRRELITQLICHFELDLDAFGSKMDIDMQTYFADEWQQLQPMQNDGLLEFDQHQLRVTDQGRMLIRNICMVFDAYLGQSQTRFSRAI